MSREKLYHYSYEPITAVGDVRQANINPYNDHGWYPRGIWFAPERTWPEWSSQFREKDAFAHRYKVVIGDGAKIANLATPQLAVEFTDRFGVMPEKSGYGVMRIRWEDVAKEFDGILIGFKPRSYFHHIHDTLDWSEAWDIPSGCVWRFDDVQLIARGGAVVPRVPVHKHWLESYEDAEREPFLRNSTVTAFVGGKWMMMEASMVSMKTFSVENPDGSVSEWQMPFVERA